MGFRLNRSCRSLVRLGLAVLALGIAANRVGAQPSAPVELAGVPQRINNDGQVAGWVYVGPDAHAAIYSNGVWRDLAVPAGDELSTFFGISNAGAAVGFSFASLDGGADNRWQAIQATAGATSVQALAMLPPDSFAYAINDSGAVVGCLNRYDDIYPDPHRAFLYANGSVTDLHALLATNPLYDYTCARDVNNAGVVVGEFQSSSAPQRGFMYRNGVATPLAQSPTAYLSNARAVSDTGKIVGEGRLAGFTADHALVYDVATGAITSLGLEATAAYNSRPNDINGPGDVVGMMFLGVGEHAFLASGGQVKDLNDLLPAGSEWVLQEAQSINDSGQIVGRGYLTSSPTITRYFLMTYNLPPTVALDGPYSVKEGEVVDLAAVAGDEEASTLTYEWSVVAGSGAIQTSNGPTATFSTADGDGAPGSTATVRLTVTDAGGLMATAEALIAIDNEAPTATFSAAPSSVYAGEVVTLSFSGATDPSAADTAAGFTYAFACSSPEALGPPSSVASHQCTYSVAGGKTARGRIADKDGYRDGTVSVTVLSPQHGLGGLIQEVRQLLASGALGCGNANALIVKLQGAIQHLEKGNVRPAVNKIQAFINQVEAFIRTGKLMPGTGQPLIDQARRIIAALTS